MRVVSGRARGCKLMAPAGLGTRPTADRMKEALFSMLAEDVPNAEFLDLFSGTGQIGIEALSRGAASAVFVERDMACADIIRKNLARAKLSEFGQVLCCCCLEAITALGRGGRAFDIVFMDPPYGHGLAGAALSALAASGVLKPGGFAVAEMGGGESLPETDGLYVFKKKEYKTTVFIFWRFRA